MVMWFVGVFNNCFFIFVNDIYWVIWNYVIFCKIFNCIYLKSLEFVYCNVYLIVFVVNMVFISYFNVIMIWKLNWDLCVVVFCDDFKYIVIVCRGVGDGIVFFI